MDFCLHTAEIGGSFSFSLFVAHREIRSALASDWAEKLLAMAEKDKAVSAQSVSAFVQESEIKIRAIQTKLQRLLDGYLEQDIEREIYRLEK